MRVGLNILHLRATLGALELKGGDGVPVIPRYFVLEACPRATVRAVRLSSLQVGQTRVTDDALALQALMTVLQVNSLQAHRTFEIDG